MIEMTGTIFAMAGDEILMGSNSALGPVDAQISVSGKNFSADVFLDVRRKIVRSIERHGKLNPAYIPILQNISPGEIQNCERWSYEYISQVRNVEEKAGIR